ncbi:hypothetical protein N9A45_01910 [bacterium]|nr:hypothetical protein [bacterium]
MFTLFAKDLRHLLPAEPKRGRNGRDPNKRPSQKRRNGSSSSSSSSSSASSSSSSSSSSSAAPEESLSSANILNVRNIEQRLAPKRLELNTVLHDTVKEYEAFAKRQYWSMAESELLEATRNTYWNNWEELPMGGNSYIFKDGILYVFTDVPYKDATTDPRKLGPNKRAMWIKINGQKKPNFIWCCPDTRAHDIPYSSAEKAYLVVIIQRGLHNKRVRHTVKGIYLKRGDSCGYTLEEYTIPSGVNKGFKIIRENVFKGKRVLYMEPLSIKGSNKIKKKHKDRHLKCQMLKHELKNLSDDITTLETELRSNRDRINDELEERIVQICHALSNANNDPKRLAQCEILLDRLEEDTKDLYWNYAVTTPLKGKSNQVGKDGVFSYVLAHQNSERKKCTWLDDKNVLLWYLPADEAPHITMGSVVGVIEKQDTTPVTHTFRGLYMAMFKSADRYGKCLVLRRLNPGFDSGLATLCTDEEQTKTQRGQRIDQMKHRDEIIEKIRKKYAAFREEQERLKEFDEMFGFDTTDDEDDESKN